MTALWIVLAFVAISIQSAVAAALCRRTPKFTFFYQNQKRPFKLTFSMVESDDQPSGGVLAFTAITTRRLGYGCQTRSKLNDA